MKKRWMLATAAILGCQIAGATVQAQSGCPFSVSYLQKMWDGNALPSLWEKPEVVMPQVAEEMVRENGAEEERGSESATGEIASAESLIFVGDSRVVGMAEAGGFHYVGEVGIGYHWLVSDGISWLQQEMAANPTLPIVFCLGVNDLQNLDSYLSYYQTLLGQYPEKEMYFMSVNPVNEEAEIYSGYTVSNQAIEAFNASLMETFPERYIDVYSFLKANGFGTGDGLHYDLNTYAGIQQYTLLMVNMLRNFG